MDVNFKGYNENILTFESDDSITKTGTLVKMSGDGKVCACAKDENFCGVCVAINDGFVSVAMQGYIELPSTAKIQVGYNKLSTGANLAVAQSVSGREYLVLNSTDKTIGFIL